MQNDSCNSICQSATEVPQKKRSRAASLFYQLVSAGEQLLQYGQAKRFCGRLPADALTSRNKDRGTERVNAGSLIC
jgi:hypothetical protein